MSLLTALQAAARELKIAVPSTIVTNTSNHDAMLLLRMANKEAKAMRTRYSWQILTKEHTFTTLAADSQGSSSLPSDFLRFVPETAFNRTLRRPIVGPINQSEWAEYKANLIVPADPVWRVRGGVILMAPLQTAGQTIAYEYISKWSVSVAATPTTPAKDAFTLDTDTWLWDEELLTLAVIWRWRQHKGMAFEDARLDFERMVTDAFIADGGKPRIQTGVTKASAHSRGKPTIRDYNTIT